MTDSTKLISKLNSKISALRGKIAALEDAANNRTPLQGTWTHAINEHFRTCSVCNISMGLEEGEMLSRFKYCPFCGAEMETKE